MKKQLFYTIILLFLLLTTGCNRPLMDELADDGNYHYQNKDLGFNIDLPPEFIYYQTQRTDRRGYHDLEIFVPTNDTDYPQEVPSYAKPVIVRVYYIDDWETIHKQYTDYDEYVSLGQKGDRIYMLKFWSEIPDDWVSKWNDEIRKFIIKNFKIR